MPLRSMCLLVQALRDALEKLTHYSCQSTVLQSDGRAGVCCSASSLTRAFR